MATTKLSWNLTLLRLKLTISNEAKDVTAKFDIKIENEYDCTNPKKMASLSHLETMQILKSSDTTKLPLARYYIRYPNHC